MLRLLHKITSLKNLQSSQRGQIATLLILMMVVVLIFILATVNLGQNALTALNLANVADAVALSLGSQLATKANMYAYELSNCSTCNRCGSTYACASSGIWGIVLAAVLAIVAIVVAPYIVGFLGLTLTGEVAVIAGGIGGAIGGAIGGRIDTKTADGMMLGAIHGVMIGLSIGTAATSLASLETTTATTGVETATATSQIASTVAISPFAVAMDILSVPASIYNAYLAQNINSSALSKAVKKLNSLEEKDSYREAAFLSALIQTVDDPNQVKDTYFFDHDNNPDTPAQKRESDNDGNFDELVPAFQVWWAKRTDGFKLIAEDLKKETDNFFKTLNGYKDFFKTQYSCPPIGEPESELCFNRFLDYYGITGCNGLLAQTLSALKTNYSSELYFWPDELEIVIRELYRFVRFVESFQSRPEIARTWQTWIKQFYDPQTKTDLYDTLDVLVKGKTTAQGTFYGLKNWRDRLEEVRKKLPDCRLGWLSSGGSCIDKGDSFLVYDNKYCCFPNPPCKNSSEGTLKGSIDSDLDYEIDESIAGIDELIKKINGVRSLLEQYYTRMWNIYNGVGIIEGGRNPITYRWADTRCPKDNNGNFTACHSVSVRIKDTNWQGPDKNDFYVPEIEYTKNWDWGVKEECLKLKNYNRTILVEITREDATDKPLGVLGKWNPFSQEKITRTSKVSYSYDRVNLSK